MTPYEQKSLTSRFSHYLINHPWQSIGFALALIAALVPGLSRLKTDFSYRIWFRETDPLLAEFDAFERRFGNDEMIAVVLNSPDGVFDTTTLESVQKMTEELWLVPEVIRVESLTNYNWTHADGDDVMVEPLIPDDEPLTAELLAKRRAVAVNHEIIPGFLISKDAEATVLYAWLKPAIGGSPDFDLVISEARKLMDRHRGEGDHELYLTGPSAISSTFKEVTQDDLQTVVPLLLGAVVLFLLISFRRLSGLLLPLFLIFGSIFATLGFAGWFGIRFNNLTSIVPHILIAISVADAVHILVTYFQFRRSGLERKEATHKTLQKNLQPTLLTSVSTSIGFFSFSSAEIIPIVQMGVLAGTGTLIAWLITIFLITPLLAYLPIKVKVSKGIDTIREPHPLALRYARWLQRYRWLVIGAFVLAVGTSAYLAMQNQINSNPFKYFAENVPTRIANEFAEDKIGGMQGLEITLNSGRADGIKDPEFLAKVEAFQIYLDSLPHISKTIAITDIIKQTNRSLEGDDPAAYIIPDNQELIAQELFLYTMSLPQGMDLNNRMTLDNDMIRLTAMSDLHDSRSMLQEIKKIEAKAKTLELEAIVTGKMPLYHNMNPYVVKTFFTSISMALILVSIIMILALRSVALGLFAMIPNTVPLVFGGMFMSVLGKPVDIGTVLVTATCLGIAVDDTIHFLANYNRWRKVGDSPARAVAHVLTSTGPALLVTTLILVVAFSTFAWASFVPNINFGIITAIVLSSALFTDFTLLPAMLLKKPSEEAVMIPGREVLV